MMGLLFIEMDQYQKAILQAKDFNVIKYFVEYLKIIIFVTI